LFAKGYVIFNRRESSGTTKLAMVTLLMVRMWQNLSMKIRAIEDFFPL